MPGRTRDWKIQCREDFHFIIPEGWLRTARRFNAGTKVNGRQVPEGRLKSHASGNHPLQNINSASMSVVMQKRASNRVDNICSRHKHTWNDWLNS